MRNAALGYVAALALSTAAWVQPAAATILSGNVSVDNQFVAYLSTNDSVAGTIIGSGTDWGTTYAVGGTLTNGVTNYLHIFAEDLGGPNMFIGEFSLSDGNFAFANGTQSLLTNATDWLVSPTGFGSGYAAPFDQGADGCCVWGNRPGINDSARHIWDSNLEDSNVYFSTPIGFVGTTEVPEPGTLLLMGAALLALAGLRRRLAAA